MYTIRSVVLEEMLHMTLVANLLNAVGDRPRVADPDFVRRYPARLPYSGGEVITVTDLTSALLALRVITEQGEGLRDSIFDSDDQLFGEDREVAHYFRFNEILTGRTYGPHDTPGTAIRTPIPPRHPAATSPAPPSRSTATSSTTATRSSPPGSTRQA